MGLFRFLLAICVVMAHTASISPLIKLNYLNATSSVIIFFIISGYYMQMILSEKYTSTNLGKLNNIKFYLSRYIRIFPTYFICLVATFIYIYYINNSLPAISDMQIAIVKIYNLPNNIENIIFKIWYLISSIFIVFQDLCLNLVVHNDIAKFTLDRSSGSIYVPSAFIVPQAWSIGSELFFYLLAPLIVKINTRYIVIIIISLLLMALLFIQYSSLGDIYYRATPFTLVYFIIGCLLYRCRDKFNIYQSKENYSVKLFSAYFFVICITLFFPWNGLFFTFPLVLICSIFIPSLFFITKDNLMDRFLGELSYPIYIYHMLFFWIASNNWENFDWIAIKWGLNSLQLITLISILGTLIASIITVFLISRIIDPWRYKIIKI
jgi:peptidoglycan/LPS O-acetylase OafA/YrhL